jgi:membrane fusion protein, multidrug efflux system
MDDRTKTDLNEAWPGPHTRPAHTPPKPAAPPRRRGGRVVGIIILLLVVLGVAWWVHTRPQPDARRGRPQPPVATALVQSGDVDININALGTVTSLATVTIRSQISGYLMNVAFKEGDIVKKGDLLAEIDSRPYQLALSQAEGALKRDQAMLQSAQLDLERYTNLAKTNAIPRQQLDQQAALVLQDQGNVITDQAQIDTAKLNITYCHIVAPVNGRLGLRQVDQGNYVTPGDTSGLVVITQVQPISVLFTVPEDNLQAIAKRIQAGAVLPATALDRAGSSKIAAGSLQTFDSQIDPTTGTIKLRAQFPNDDRLLYPNQFVNIRLLIDTHKDVTTMSTAGIQRGAPGTFVYLVNADSTVSVRPVKLGVTDGDRVEVLSGLNPGDRIVIDGADKLRDGAKVIIRSENNPPQANPGQSPAGPNKSGGGKKRRSEGGQQQ